MLKQSISLVVLCFAGHVFAADIVVNTTEDVVRADDQCSLREAIEYINQERPETGYNGCGGKGSSNTIYLESKTYNLTKEILISRAVNFRTQYIAAPTNNVLGKQNAIIKMTGTDRLFNIDRKSENTATKDDDNAPISVNFSEITLKGCDAELCKEQGGLIYNKEFLRFEYSQLLNGKAKLGGAIYNVGKYNPTKTSGAVEIFNSVMQGNKAEKGGVILGEIPQYVVVSSIVRDNEVTNANSALFDAIDGFDKDTSTNIGGVLVRGIQNSTIFNNKGFAIRVMDAVSVLNVTMILNSKGLIFDAPFDQGVVANNILAKNGSEDCKIVSGGTAKQLSNNLYSKGCAGTQSQILGSINLIASTTTEGKCDFNSDGILCPFKEYNDIALGFFKPRLLESYQSLNDSPIVNKGPNSLNDIRVCMTTDQRGFVRENNRDLCDRGAIELRVDPSTIGNVGDDIEYNNVAKMSITDRLVDGELISPAQCQKIFGNEPNNKPWQPGCLKIEQTNTPSKGELTLTQDGDISYQPNGNWHGSDEFKILVVTTTTRFSDSLNQYIQIPTKVVQSPPDDFKDYSVKTSGGSYGLGALLVLLGLVTLRRNKK